MCSGTASGSTGTTLAVSAQTTAPGLPTTQALLVTGPDKADYLVWRGSKLLLFSRSNAREALGYGSTPRTAVSAAFLNSLPSGPGSGPSAGGGQGRGRTVAGRPEHPDR